MRCPHCHSSISPLVPYDRPLEGGRAFVQDCPFCHRIMNIRPRLTTDPPLVPDDLTDKQIERLLFTRWRLGIETGRLLEPPAAA